MYNRIADNPSLMEHGATVELSLWRHVGYPAQAEPALNVAISGAAALPATLAQL